MDKHTELDLAQRLSEVELRLAALNTFVTNMEAFVARTESLARATGAMWEAGLWKDVEPVGALSLI